MCRFKLLFFVIFVTNLYSTDAQISDQRLCVDEECKEAISYAKTLIRYSSPDSRILSFAPNVDVVIYSKSAGSREDLWGVEINGKRGYVPKHMLRETKILQKPTLLVNTEFSNDPETLQVPSKVEPDKVQEPYEVVDGTTIYSPHDAINPSTTETSVQATTLVAGTNTIEQSIAGDQVASQSSSPPTTLEDSSNGRSDNLSVEESETQEVENKIQLEKESDIAPSTEETSAGKIMGANPSLEQLTTEVKPAETQEDSGADLSQLPATASLNPQPNSPENLDQSIETVTEEPVPSLSQPSVSPPSEQVEAARAEQVASSEDLVQPPVTEAAEQVEIEVVQSGDSTSAVDVEAAEETSTESNESNLNLENFVASAEETNTSTEASEEATKIASVEIKNEDQNQGTDETQSEEISDQNVLMNEATTINPNPEVPLPFEDLVIDVTPNPLDTETEIESVEDARPTLPRLNLFAPVRFQTAKEQEESKEEVPATNLNEVEATLNVTETEDDTASKEEVNENGGMEAFSTHSEEDSLIGDAQYENAVGNENSVVENESLVVEQEPSEDSVVDNEEWVVENADPGFIAGLFSFFSSPLEKADEQLTEPEHPSHTHASIFDEQHVKEQFCDAATSGATEPNETTAIMDFLTFNSDVFLYLVTTAISVIIFLFGYIAFDKSKREAPLIAKINKLERDLLVTVKENQLLQEKLSTESGYDTNDKVPNEAYESLTHDFQQVMVLKNALEEQVQSLEKELENSTEVGLELNRMLSEILSSQSGSDVIKANVEHLQRQLVDQQSTANSMNESLAVANTENHELRLELELSNKKVVELQAELDKLLLNILKIEEEKDAQQGSLENEIAIYKLKHEEMSNLFRAREEEYNSELGHLKSRLEQAERKAELKTKEHGVLLETVKQLKSVKNNVEVLEKLLDASGAKAELQLLQSENQRFSERLAQEQELKSSYEKRAQATTEEVRLLKEKYDEADKSRVEAQTKLEVLSNYFKDREAQWQKEIGKHEALWAERAGEATSTTERIKFMQDQVQNYKSQTESLKQEIMSQEIELKSQISVLEKKAHENWVSARHAERKLEESKQEAAQLRHRLTLRERAIQEDKHQHRLGLQSPIEQNGEMPISPLESPASPPLLFGVRDHLTKSPPIPGLPPFLPPPPGAPFMPPPLPGVPPFMPPPPGNFFPDHRPPPLGRMSSPPLNSRYSPSSRGYSPYDRNSSSPSDSEYGTSPPHRRAYSPYREERRDYKRAPPPVRTNGRNIKKGGSSGNSNESLEKINRQQSKV